MQSKKLTKSRPRASTQNYLDITEISNDTVILKDGTLRAVLLVSSLNFYLKSEDEQNAIIAGYIDFLNSFDFPIQIVIQSRRLRIDDYIKKLEEREKAQTKEQLRLQIADYRAFVTELVELNQIMTKNFFVIIPLASAHGKERGFWAQLSGVLTPATVIHLSRKEFFKRLKVLEQRVFHIQAGLQSLGLRLERLDTQALIELYYNVYNPSTVYHQPLPRVDAQRIEYP